MFLIGGPDGDDDVCSHISPFPEIEPVVMKQATIKVSVEETIILYWLLYMRFSMAPDPAHRFFGQTV